MAITQTKLLPSDLSTKIGQKIVIRQNSDNSEKRGTIIAYDSAKQSVQVDINKSHIWISTAVNSGLYIYSENFT